MQNKRRLLKKTFMSSNSNLVILFQKPSFDRNSWNADKYDVYVCLSVQLSVWPFVCPSFCPCQACLEVSFFFFSGSLNFTRAHWIILNKAFGKGCLWEYAQLSSESKLSCSAQSVPNGQTISRFWSLLRLAFMKWRFFSKAFWFFSAL